jgi:tripartite-type tricarboxylate transporter receptor subunit TctC
VRPTLSTLFRTLAWLVAVVPALSAAQETYPSRAIRIVVPYPAATPPDVLARIAAEKLSASWKNPVIVEVRDGAAGTIGTAQVARAAADGYTLLFTPDFPIVMSPAIGKTPYDARNDFAPVAALAQGVSLLAVNPSLGINHVNDLIAMAKANPGKLTYGSSGQASASYMCIALLKRAAGIDLTEIPYKGAAPAIQAVMTGEISMYCSPSFQALPHVRSGKLKALGTTGPKPSPLSPDIPSIAEQGQPDVTVSTWYGMFAPAGTPEPALEKIRVGVKAAFEDPEVRERLARAGLEPIWIGGRDFEARIKADLEKWSKLAKDAGIRAPQ